MKTLVFCMLLMPFSAFALTDKEVMESAETTPLTVVCKYEGGPHRVMVHFVEDPKAVPGVYSVVNGKFYLAHKIVKVTYEMYGESYAKVGYLDNGNKVRLFMSVDRSDLVGYIEKSDVFFGEDAQLYSCVDIKLK